MAPSQPQPAAELDTISRDHTVSKRAQKLAMNKRFTFWKNRAPSRNPKKHTLTVGDRVVQAKKREQHRHKYQDALADAQVTVWELAEGLRNRFGKHSVNHYFNDLIHRAHKSRSERKVNPWNAYQKLELERMQRRPFMTSIACCLTYGSLGEAGDDASNLNLTEINKQISDRWKTLSPAEREAITAESVQRIEEQRERKRLMAHSVPLNSFHDVRSTIQSVETQVGCFLFIDSQILSSCSCHGCTRGLASNSCWWLVDLLLRTMQSHLRTSRAIRLKGSSARR